MSSPWSLEGFGDCLDQWIDRDHPDTSLRLVVTNWLFSRFEDPYQGVRREDNFENLWYGTVPFSRRTTAYRLAVPMNASGPAEAGPEDATVPTDGAGGDSDAFPAPHDDGRPVWSPADHHRREGASVA